MTSPEAPTQVSGPHAISSAREEVKTTTGQLSYVGIVNRDVKAESKGGDGPALSVRATRKEPTNPVMAR